MNLDDTKKLLSRDMEASDPHDLLVNVLEAAIELLSLEGNDFAWSYWLDAGEAVSEVRFMLDLVKRGVLPERMDVAVLFLPTGPIQEVSLSSGWAETFLKVAERYDHVETRLWGRS